MKPTRTTNRLHFEDLDPRRFEDLCLQLIYKDRNWNEINHIGRLGYDKGVDITAIEKDHKTKINWYVQCKRYKSISKGEIKKVIDKIRKNYGSRGKLLLIISCDITKPKYDYYYNYAKKIGFMGAEIWSQSLLEAKLYNDYPDLLYIYFGIKVREHGSEVEQIRRKKKIRDKLKKDFIAKFDTEKPLIGPHRFKCSDIILKAINGNDTNEFQENEFGSKNKFGWYSSKKVEPYHIHDEGFEVICGIKVVKVNRDGLWNFVESMKPQQGHKMFKVFEIGNIALDNIKECDLDNDDG
jgi:hypothetical protein